MIGMRCNLMRKILLFLVILALCGLSGCMEQGGDDYAGSGLQIYTEEFPPYNYLGPDGKITGSSTEVVQEILSRRGEEAEISLVSWSDGYQRTLETPNTVLYSAARTAEREPLFSWVGPAGSYDFVFYAKNGSAIRIESLDAARKAGTIGVVKDDARHQFLQENNVVDVATYPDDVSCVQALMAGDVTLWLGSSAIAAANIEKAGYAPEEVVALYPVRTVELFIAFNKQTSPELVADWQKTLDAMKADGTYDAIMARYFGEKAPSDGKDPVLSSLVALTDLRLSGIARTLDLLALTSDVQSGDWERIRPLLVELERSENAARFWYARPDGSYYTTVDDLVSGNLMVRSYFPGVLAGERAIGPVVVSLSTGRTTAIVAVPVKDGEEVTGVLGASVYSGVLSRDLSRILSLPQDMFFFALDDTGKYIINSGEQRIGQDPLVQETPAAQEVFRTIMQQDSGKTSAYLEGKTYTVTFERSPLTGWRFGVAEIFE
jgi:ABC-type amino acid transport substrate-binding protein